LTFAKFTGQKKVGSKFVDVLPKKEAEQDSNGGPAMKSKKQQQGPETTQGEDFNMEDTTPNDSKLEESKAGPNGDGTLLANRTRRYAARLRSTTPPVMKKMRSTRNVRANRKEHEVQQKPDENLSHPITLKACYQPESDVGTNAEEKTNISKDEENGRNLTADKAVEAANIKRIVTNIQRELDNLRQSTISPRYPNLISTAVQGCSRALEPLDSFLLTELDRAEVVKEIIEEGSVHADAHDSGKNLAPTDTTCYSGDLQPAHKQELPVPSTHTTKQPPSKASITPVCKGGESPDHISHQSRGLTSLPMASRRRSGRLSLTEPPSYYTSLYDSEPGSSEAKPKRRSSAPSLAARKDSEDS
jgi:hypothetical protein